MLRLHGFRFSNYHSLVKVVLFERGLEFEEVITYPLADEAYRAKNPTGKFPCLEIEDGTFLGESKVILNYLEDAYPDVPLLPENPLERALVRELMEVIDLYLEWPARSLYPEVFSAVGKVSDEVKSTARAGVAQGLTALKKLARFNPLHRGAPTQPRRLQRHLPLRPRRHCQQGHLRREHSGRSASREAAPGAD